MFVRGYLYIKENTMKTKHPTELQNILIIAYIDVYGPLHMSFSKLIGTLYKANKPH